MIIKHTEKKKKEPPATALLLSGVPGSLLYFVLNNSQMFENEFIYKPNHVSSQADVDCSSVAKHQYTRCYTGSAHLMASIPDGACK